DGEVGPDDVPVLGLGPQVEVTVAPSHTMVEGHSKTEVGVLTHIGLASISGHRDRPQIEPDDAVEHLVDERLVSGCDVDAFASVAQRQGPLVGEDDAALLRDSMTRCLISTDTGLFSSAAS